MICRGMVITCEGTQRVCKFRALQLPSEAGAEGEVPEEEGAASGRTECSQLWPHV